MPPQSPQPPQSARPKPLAVLFATPECAPLAKTGGLGDVSAALPVALRREGLDARILLPGYTSVLDACKDAKLLATLQVLGHEVRLLESILPGSDVESTLPGSGVPLYILDAPPLYRRGGGPYQADDGEDWDDNPIRFGVLSKAAALLASDASPIDWRPDILHCNDWPTALAPLYLRFAAGARAKSIATIHNLAFQGVFDWEKVESLALPPESRGTEGLEYHGKASFLKGGLVFADAITTVSPTYAREIQGDALGFGLDGVLRARRSSLHGVLNGIDTELWNPSKDPHLASAYGILTLERKVANKRLLKRRFGLTGDDAVPLLATVARVTHQKGLDLLAEALPHLAALPAQVVVVGTGDRQMIARLKAVQAAHPQSFSLQMGFDEPLAHLVEGGADAFLMPSRFEPCGMNQMYSQRYGTPPVAHATGGLIDTIVDDDGTAPDATGFLFRHATANALVEGVRRAVAAYRAPVRWKGLQTRGMTRDFGWGPAARAYAKIYADLL